jgi:hypothetical protein
MALGRLREVHLDHPIVVARDDQLLVDASDSVDRCAIIISRALA